MIATPIVRGILYRVQCGQYDQLISASNPLVAIIIAAKVIYGQN